MVRRSVHHAALLWLVGSVQFVAGMVAVQLAWKGPPTYSLSSNYISDLGNTGCGPWPDASSHIVCSPWHSVFNASIIVLGLCIVLGTLLIRTGFPPRRSSKVGLVLIAIAAVGSISVGLSPENVRTAVHSASALVAFLAGNLSLVVLGVAMFRDTRWDGFRAYSVFSGLIGLVATFLFLRGIYLGLGVGGMERLIVAPLLLWLVVVSIHLLRIPQYAPRAIPGG